VVGGVSRPGEIAVALGVKPPAVSGIIDRLVVKGLIERRQEDDDRRTVSCTLTRAGMDELDRIFRVSERRVRAMAESLSSEELADVVRCMKILARAAEARPASGRQSDQIVNQDGITI
jgi:DNA-binding MarR family transcriptional regulator